VVALDPFESGLAGLLIAEKYDREFQVHITEDFYIPEFKAKSKSNAWRMRIASHVLKRTQSVRVSTEMIKTQIAKKFPKISDLALLPRHYDIQSILKATEEKGSETAFPQFSFVILFVGKLDHDSTLFRAMDASRSILTAKSIGMVVVGDGPNLKEFQKRAEILGIKEQMLFIKDSTALISYLKSANVLLVSDVTEASDETVIKAAAAGLPIIAAHTELRDDLFVDGESAFLCNKDDTVEFSEKLVKFLNANSLRMQFANNARDIIKTRLHEDPNAYKLAYRDSIERVFTEEAPAEVVE
jgi:glycosyltransferase involved in cell wall biosynthesis